MNIENIMSENIHHQKDTQSHEIVFFLNDTLLSRLQVDSLRILKHVHKVWHLKTKQTSRIPCALKENKLFNENSSMYQTRSEMLTIISPLRYMFTLKSTPDPTENLFL